MEMPTDHSPYPISRDPQHLLFNHLNWHGHSAIYIDWQLPFDVPHTLHLDRSFYSMPSYQYNLFILQSSLSPPPSSSKTSLGCGSSPKVILFMFSQIWPVYKSKCDHLITPCKGLLKLEFSSETFSQFLLVLMVSLTKI